MDTVSADPYYFLKQVEPWSLSQMYLPFAVFLFTHNLWFTLSLVFLTKFVEAAVYTTLGSFFIFNLGEGDRLETYNDAAIGDPLAAFLGIFAAWFITHLFQSGRILAAPWTPANFRLHAGYYLRNIVGLLLMVVFSVFLSFDYHQEQGQCGAPFGIVMYLLSGVIVIVSLFYLNRNPRDLQWVWSHPPVAKRFSLRARYNATYGMWLLAHCGSCLCFMCTWNTTFVMALASVVAVMVAATLTWICVDANYRRGEGESFSPMNFFRCMMPQWGALGDVTSETLAIPGPASFSAVPSLRGETPGFLLVERPTASMMKDTEAGLNTNTNQSNVLNNSNVFSSGVLLSNNLRKDQQPPSAGGAGL